MRVKIFITIMAVAALDFGIVLLLSIYVSFRATEYEKLAALETSSKKEVIQLEKSQLLIPTSTKLLKIADLYLELEEYDSAEEKYKKLITTDKSEAPYEGLYKLSALRGDKTAATTYATKTGDSDKKKEECLINYLKIGERDFLKKISKEPANCTNNSLGDFLISIDQSHDSNYLTLEGIKKHYQDGYLKIAKDEILLLEKENNNYRDAYILGYYIFTTLGDQPKAEKQKQEAIRIDPLAFIE